MERRTLAWRRRGAIVGRNPRINAGFELGASRAILTGMGALLWQPEWEVQGHVLHGWAGWGLQKVPLMSGTIVPAVQLKKVHVVQALFYMGSSWFASLCHSLFPTCWWRIVGHCQTAGLRTIGCIKLLSGCILQQTLCKQHFQNC